MSHPDPHPQGTTTTWSSAFQYRKGVLFCEDVSLVAIAREVGTPCYVYSKNALLENCRRLQSAFRAIDPLICYAVKANSNLSILSLVRDEGCGFDVVSAGELYRLKQIKADPQKIVFSGVGKTIPELETAIEEQLLAINVESLPELETLIELSRQKSRSTSISFRINPNVDTLTHPYIATGLRQHKFGIDLDHTSTIIEALRRAPWLQLCGLGFHLGSQILDVEPFLDAFLKLKQVAAEFRAEGFPVEHLDLGGGLGIPYKDEKPVDLGRYANFLTKEQDHYRILLEPGRFLVGNAGVLLNRVLYRKTNHGKHFVVVDGAMNDLLRPSLYQAYHEVLALEQKTEEILADVVGPVCETGDFFARDRSLPAVEQGDYLAIMNAGAYGFPLSSNYNSRLRAAEVLVEEDQVGTVRRRENLEDLIRGEEIS